MSEKRLQIILPFVILVLGALAMVVMIRSRPPAATRPPEVFAPLVRTMEVTRQEHQLIVRTQGTVRPRTESALVAEVAGRVVEVSPSFASGGFFAKGDLLVRIEDRDYELAVVTARGQVAQARVRLETEEAQARVAREEWQALGKGDNSPLATRELQVQEARAALAAAEARLEQAERDLARTRILAPFDGRVRQKLVDVGQFVSPGVPAGQVFAVDHVEVRLPIADAELAYLDLPLQYRGASRDRPGPPVVLHADFAGGRHQWKGRIVRVEGEVDPVSRMVHVIAQVDKPYEKKQGSDGIPLAVGMFVEAEIIGRKVDGVVILPRSALRRDNTVYVVDAEDRLRIHAVDVVKLDRDEVIVSSGLSDGDNVCVSALEAVTDGMQVRTRGREDAGEEGTPDSLRAAGGER